MTEVTTYIGVDPGRSGAIAVIFPNGSVRGILKLKDATPADVVSFLAEQVIFTSSAAALERVHAMPKQGVASTFKFGESYGMLQMALVAVGVRYELVTPHCWQRDLHALSRGDKRVTKAAASRMFPGVKVTHAIADALLIAEWARACGRWRVQGG